MSKTTTPDEDPYAAKLDRIIELLEQRTGQTIIYNPPPVWAPQPYPSPPYVTCGIPGTTGTLWNAP